MSALTVALERIMKWLRTNQPKYADSFLLGLKCQEIQIIEVEFGFKLPKEIHELYQWRNGMTTDAKALCFPTLEFLPISRAIEYSKGCNQYIEERQKNLIDDGEWYEISPLFIFIENNGNFCGIPLVKDRREKLPIVDVGEGDMPRIFYASLTDMMLTLAECYETGAYYLDDEGFICEDEDKFAQIFRKYNDSVSERFLSL
jgi:cell wall assembly regulator SMI1